MSYTAKRSQLKTSGLLTISIVGQLGVLPTPPKKSALTIDQYRSTLTAADGNLEEVDGPPQQHQSGRYGQHRVRELHGHTAHAK